MMSDNDIRKGFQSKLQGFEAPVPPDGWESVERSLQAASAARKALRRRWFAGSAAAVLVLLVGSLWFLRNPLDETGTIVSESKSTDIPAIIDRMQDDGVDMGQNPDVSPESQLPVDPVSIGQSAGAGISRKAGAVKATSVRGATSSGLLAAWMERKKSQHESPENKIDASMLHKLAESAKNDASQNGKGLRNEDEVIIVGGDDEILLAGGIIPEKENGPLLLSLSGRGGLSGYQQTVNSPMTLRSASTTSVESNNNILQSYTSNMVDNTSVMEHDQPVSFGITVSKYIFDDLSVETGLVYSYLHSKVRNSSDLRKNDEEQVLHYLGIPLNINYNIFSLRKLNVYASIGGMVEKDIYGEFRNISERQSDNSNNTTDESEAVEYGKISQKHPQFSVNAGVGLSYPIYDRLRLYGKIGGAYYFDAKNKHSTIYSDRKVVMDLNVGLRYEF